MNVEPEAMPLHQRAGDKVKDWLRAMAFSHFATFNFNCETTLDGSKKALSDFLARWDRRVLGRRFNKQPHDKRTQLIGFVEHIDSNLHYHALVRPAQGCGTPQPDFALEGPPLWRCIIPSGQLYVPRISTDGWLPADEGMIALDHLDRIASYITKDLKKQRNYENFVLSGEFLPFNVH